MIIKCKNAETYVMYNTIVFMVLILVWLFLIIPVIMIITSMSVKPVLNISAVFSMLFAFWRIVADKSLREDFTPYFLGAMFFGMAVPMKYVVDKFIKYELVKQGDTDEN